MLIKLNPQAKRLLKQQYYALISNEQTVCTSIATIKRIITWCEQEYIEPGKWLVQNKQYRFTRVGIEKIRDAYLLSMREDIFENFSQDTHQTAATKSSDEKQGKVKPTEHLMLAALTGGQVFSGFQEQFHNSHQVNLELDIRLLDYSMFDALLMIENRDSFNDWFLFQPHVVPALNNVLVMYRGDSQYAVAANNLLQQWRGAKSDSAVIYFGDFDLSGLRLAVSAGCTHLLLPDYQWLIEHTIKQHYPAEQEKYLMQLLIDCPKGWKILLNMMSEARRGVRQQNMYEVPLKLYVAT